jgi:hypothetical protein
MRVVVTGNLPFDEWIASSAVSVQLANAQATKPAKTGAAASRDFANSELPDCRAPDKWRTETVGAIATVEIGTSRP